MGRVLHIGKFYPPHRGGMEQVLQDLVCRQSQRFDVSVLCYADERRTTSESRDGARITRVAALGTIASMPVCPELFWRIRDYEPDLVHLHTPNPLAALALLTRFLKCPIIVEHHSDTIGRRALRHLSDPFVRAIMKRADCIIATSQRYVVSSPELRPYLGKISIVPCGINLPSITPEILASAQVIRKTYGDRLVLAVGRLVPYKGFDILIDAMREVNGTLVIIGNGPLRGTLQLQIERARLTKRVNLLSNVADVAPYLKAADVFALPSISRAEAFGLVQVEAMACGTPVVNTHVNSAVPEISLHGVTGLTVPAGEASGLAAALNLLLSSEELRATYGSAARIRVSEHFTADLMAQRTEAIYARLGVLGTQPVKSEAPREPKRSTYVEPLAALGDQRRVGNSSGQ